MFQCKIPSRSRPGTYWIVTDKNGKIDCTCPAVKRCRHERIYLKWRDGIKGNSSNCFYTHNCYNLEKHHLLRAADRQKSLTIWLTHWIHRRATDDKEFELHLRDLFFNQREMDKINFKARVKEVSVKNLVSGDSEPRMKIETENIAEAVKLAELKPEDLIKISCVDTAQFYASVLKVGKINKDGEQLSVYLSAAPAEVRNVLVCGLLPAGTEIDVLFNK